MIALIQSRGAIGVLLLATIVASLRFPFFPTVANFENIGTAASFLGLVAIGQTFVIILGGFDLSVGSLIGLGSVLAAYALPYGWWAALLVPALAGGAVGLVDGLLIARAGMAPFIVTLAALLGVRGIALVLAKNSLVIATPGVFGLIANGQILGIDNLIWIVFIGFAIAAIVLNRTRYGVAVFAIGGNEEAARMLGVPVARIKVLTYVVSGTLAGLSGALLAAHLSSGISTAGQGEELKSIAAAVIGGVLLTGGVGTMAGALSGVLLLGLIENVIDQIGNLSSYYQNLASGVFLLIAVLIQTVLTRRRR
ncbi:monosaccharide ABC transporter membrane protein, CUT2 family [Acidiphilium rubrum]|uniref:Monosaccharide ABC transporter membrane protein, CUT2 family n=1 Tax=Acidiphilium rubrum TaxID=526 RepID=A0A8G2CHV0_ACIRU|nr:monosaccharide ABC transporter membrane protein, CUT2 family [Acidiphilium rubrum]